MVMTPVADSLADREIFVFGLGYVGLTLAVALADAGFAVIGVEIRKSVVDDLNRGEPHFFERGLKESLGRVIESGRFKATEHFTRIQGRKAVFLITVGTPLDHQAKPRLDMIVGVTKEISDNLVDGDLVILRSTVRLGTCNSIVLPILKKSGKQFYLSFCPERTLEGDALAELHKNPQIIGAIDDISVSLSSSLFQHLTPNIVRVSGLEAAEMIKLVDNAQRDAKFAYANEIAMACDHFGISAIEVIEAGKLGYPRTDLALPGPVGGPCLEKDPYIFADGLQDLGFTPAITLVSRDVNEAVPKHAMDKINAWHKERKPSQPMRKISVLGLAFKGKPETSDTRESIGIAFASMLRDGHPDCEIYGFDPMLSHNEIERLEMTPLDSVEQAFEGADLIIIMNNHGMFARLDLAGLSAMAGKPSLIYDFWNHYRADKLTLVESSQYIAFGSHTVSGN